MKIYNEKYSLLKCKKRKIKINSCSIFNLPAQLAFLELHYYRNYVAVLSSSQLKISSRIIINSVSKLSIKSFKKKIYIAKKHCHHKYSYVLQKQIIGCFFSNSKFLCLFCWF